MSVHQINTTVGLVSPAATTVATLSTYELSWTQDEGAKPMFVCTLVVAVPTAAQFAMLRPGAGYYLSLASDRATGGVSETVLWKITSRERTLDGRVRLQAVSAELDLMSYRPSAVDRSNWANQSNVELILKNVLTKVHGARWARHSFEVAAFGQDIGVRPYQTYKPLTNLVPNGSFETGTTGWTGTRSTIRTQAWGRLGPDMGTNTLRIEGSGSNSDTFASTPITLAPNTTYTVSGYVLNGAPMATGSATSGYARSLAIVITVNGVAQILTSSNQGNNTTNGITRVWKTFTTPTTLDASGSSLRAYNGTTTGATNVVLWDGIMLVEGGRYDTDNTTDVPFFDGDVVDGTNGYNYDWTGTAGASTATRTPIINRDPEALTWSPDQTAMEFLQPILQSVGVNLWSDGYSTRNTAGAVTAKYFWALNEFGLVDVAPRVIDTFNLFELSQLDSWTATFPDGMPMFADQVVLHYTWTDSLGTNRDAYDVYPAASGKKPYYLELSDTPFAGEGRAKGIYDRISARATMFEGTTTFTRGIYVGRQLALTAAAAGGSAVGYIDAATHDPFRGTTEFRTKQTIAYTSASWFVATGSWASQTGSWAADS